MAGDDVVARIKHLFAVRGSSLYGGEAVTQLEHALQAAMLAEAEAAEPELIAAALLHDIGHLLHELPNDAPDHGVDDVHEQLAYDWLSQFFGPDVTEPVRLHVAAKRYLCAVDPSYERALSGPSLQSLRLQGGRFGDQQRRAFERNQYFEHGVRLRRWDDQAKIPGLNTPSLEHFLRYVDEAQRARPSTEAVS